MATQTRRTAVGTFENRRDAQMAVDELKRVGFRDDQIGVVYRGDDEEGVYDEHEETHAGKGAVAGAATGAGLGGLWAIGIAAGILPAIGPVIAGGTLAAILASAAGGAAAGGLVGSLIGAGIPEEEAEYYESEIHAGRTIVTVQADGRYAEAETILHRFGARDYRTAAATSVMAPAATGSTATRTRGKTGDRTVELHEEELQVKKEPVHAGEVRVRKDVQTEHKTVDVPVRKEEVVIERHPATGRHSSSSEIGESEEIRVPVSEERVHVEKRPVVKEEVTIGKRQIEETEHVGGTVKKENLRVEKEGDVHVRDRRKS